MSRQEVAADQVQVAHAYLAEYAKLDPASGSINAIGAGITRFQTNTVPFPASFFVVLQLRKPPNATFSDSVRLTVTRPNGDLAVSIEGHVHVEDDSDTINLPFGLNVMFDSAGEWWVAVSFGEDVLSRTLRIRVELAAAK